MVNAWKRESIMDKGRQIYWSAEVNRVLKIVCGEFSDMKGESPLKKK